MLVFRRRVGDAVILDGGIEVQVLEISGARVKLGFVAPAAIAIARKELLLTRAQNVQAASFNATATLNNLVSALRDPPEQVTGPIRSVSAWRGCDRAR